MMKALPSLVDTEEGRNVFYQNQWLYPQNSAKNALERRVQAVLFQESTLLIIESPLLSLGLEKLDYRWKEHCLALECEPELITISKTPDWLPLVNGNDLDGLINQVNKLFDKSLYRKIVFLSLSGGRRLNQAKFVEIENLLNEFLRSYWRNRSTMRFHIRRWTRNIIENLCQNYATIGQVTGSKPVVVVGAGPSLLKNLPWLKKNASRLNIVCADTALKTLLCMGIEPDFVVLLEGQWFTLEDFPRSLPKKTCLIADWTAHAPSLRYLSQGGTKIALIATSFYEGSTLGNLIEKSGLFRVPALGSVGVLTLYLAARLFEAASYAIVGLDFKNRPMLSHSPHSPRYDFYLNNSSRLQGLIGACHSFSGSDKVLESYADLAKNVIGAFAKQWFDLRDMGLDLGIQAYSLGEFEAILETSNPSNVKLKLRPSKGHQLIDDLEKKLADPQGSGRALVNLLCMDFNFEPEESSGYKLRFRTKELLDLINRHRQS